MKWHRKLPLLFLVVAAANCSDDGSGPFDPQSPASEVATPAVTTAPGSWSVGDPAEVSTDREDYAPGDTVVITGFGFWADETVQLDIPGAPETHEPYAFTVTADAAGSFVLSDLVMQEEDHGVTFTLTATGLSSGFTAETVFTDHGPSPVSSTSFAISASASNLVTVSVSLSGATSSTTFTAATARVANQTASTTLDVSLTTPGSPGNGTWTGSFQGECATQYKINNIGVTWRTDHNHSSTETPGATASTTTGACPPSNAAPTADAGGPYSSDEGSSVQLDGSGSSDTDGTIGSYQWSIVSFTSPDGGSCSFVGGVSTGVGPSVVCDDNGTLTVNLTVTDDDLESSSPDQATVTVSNVAPSITTAALTPFVAGYIYPITGQPAVDASWTDPGSNDTHTCSFEVFDAAAHEIGSDRACGSGLGVTEAGVYNVRVTVTDDDGGSDTETVTVVVYDPSAGFVTGGGWIDSPAGAYRPDPGLVGRATFGFVSRYKKGANRPDGNTEFQFRAGGLNFHGDAYDWLVVNQAGTNAQFKGQGVADGLGEYRFMLWATDGALDRFRIRIWQESGGSEIVLYDNGVDQALGQGSIVIHTGGKK